MQNLIITLLTIATLASCNLQRDVLTNTLQPTATPLQATITPTAETSSSVATDSWQVLDEGLSMRTIIPDGDTFAQMTALRIDPELYRFRAMYQAGNPLTLSGWQALLPDAQVIVNANFFDPDNTILGILVSDGVQFGGTFRIEGGTFIVENGVPSIRSNRTQPYQGQPVEQAVEGFPLLVENGQSVHASTNTQRSRRTVIALDTDGHVLLIVAPLLGFSLNDLSQFLATSDLNIVHALNLDGGGSSMMYAESMTPTIGAFDPVPAVLAVYKR